MQPQIDPQTNNRYAKYHQDLWSVWSGNPCGFERLSSEQIDAWKTLASYTSTECQNCHCRLRIIECYRCSECKQPFCERCINEHFETTRVENISKAFEEIEVVKQHMISLCQILQHELIQNAHPRKP